VRRATFLKSAAADLLAILTYIADESGSVAVGEAFVHKLRAQCHKLAALNATMGRARPELHPDIRSFPYMGYVIFFRYVEKRFEVVDILEGLWDIGFHFSQPDEPDKQ
jgi:plasmid stabilization system protein ParE